MSSHFMGIGGIGMSALARILLEKGVKVSGSDLVSSALIKDLEKRGAIIAPQDQEELVSHAARVIYTSALSENHFAYALIRKHHIPLLHRSDLLKELMEGSLPLLVAGAHGKTTTTSLLVHVLHTCAADPSFAVGGIVRNLGTNGRWGGGKYFVAEADESDGTFLKYHGYGAILTNIDDDHLPYWKHLEAICEGFRQFASQISSSKHLFWCGDDPLLTSLKIRGVSYGFNEGLDLQITHFKQEGWQATFSMHYLGKHYRDISIPLIGKHNALNAAAVFGLSLSLDLPETEIRKALASFEGAGRRMEKIGVKGGIDFYDDYAHHPTEIITTVHALQNAVGNRRLIVAFQPHLYSRTRDSLHTFGSAFLGANLLLITDIYPARESPIPGITGQLLADTIRLSGTQEVIFAPRSEISTALAKLLKPNDVLVTLGAGDITTVCQEVMDLLS